MAITSISEPRLHILAPNHTAVANSAPPKNMVHQGKRRNLMNPWLSSFISASMFTRVPSKLASCACHQPWIANRPTEGRSMDAGPLGGSADSGLLVQASLLHVVEDAFTVSLLILLNVLQGLSQLLVGRLEDSCVIGA